jgi:hypothetical protein
MSDNIKEKVENKIIDLIAFESDGRLVASKPEKGADLIVQKKGDYSGKEIFINLEVSKNPSEHAESLEKDLYLLVVDFDVVTQKVDDKIYFLPAFKERINKEVFINFLIQKLVTENKPAPHEGFKRKYF